MLQQRQLQQCWKLRTSCVVMINTRMAISTAPKGYGLQALHTLHRGRHPTARCSPGKPNAEWISDHRKITDSAISIRMERTRRRDWVLIASRSSSTSSASIVPSVLLTWFGSSSPRARWARICPTVLGAVKRQTASLDQHPRRMT